MGPALDFKVEAHGDGYSSIGALAFFLEKTVGGAGALHGRLTLTPLDGDSLFATYDGTQGQVNENIFITDGRGTLIFTGGTGLFAGASGRAAFTAVLAPLPSGAGTGPSQGLAFYMVDGKVSVGRGQ